MIKDFGINSNLRVGRRMLHIQTGFHNDTRKISTGIFEGGKILDMRDLLLEEGVTHEQINLELKNFHEYVIADLELLFYIADKVERANHVLSKKILGRLLLKKGFTDEAIEQFMFVREKTEEKDGCLLELGKAFYLKGEYKLAVEFLKSAVTDFPNYADLHLLLARSYKEIKEYKFAINHINKAISINNFYHEAYFTYSLILLESIVDAPNYSRLSAPEERLKEALDYMHQAANMCLDYDNHMIELILEVFNKPEKIENTITLLKIEQKRIAGKEKIDIDDNEFYLRFMFMGLDKDEKSLDNYIKKIEAELGRNPEYPDLYQSLGKAHLVKAWFYITNSTNSFRKALKLNPAFEKAAKDLKLLENDSKGFLHLIKTVIE